MSMNPDEARQFYEEDEDLAKIHAIFDAGQRVLVVTSRRPSTGRVLWIIWCCLWAGVWTVISVLAWTGVAAEWQLITFPVLDLAAMAAVTLPVGSERRR